MIKGKARVYCALLLALSMVLSMAFTGTAVYAAADLAQFGFENGQLNGFYGGEGSPILENDTTKACAGSGSMKVTFDGAGTFEAQLDNPGAAIVPGTTITFNVCVPAGVTASFQPFVLDANWGWTSSWLDKSSITADTWVKAEVKVPDSAVTPINRLGIQVIADGPGNIWIDSVSYSAPAQQQQPEIALFDFENGDVQGFFGGQGSPVIENDATKACSGSSSLKATYTGAGTYEVQVNNPSPLITADGTITFYVYVPADTTVSLQPFTLDANYGWNASWVDKSSIAKDTWVKASVKVPASAVTPVNRFGIQVISDNPGSVWLDKVTFKSDVVTNADKSALVAMIQQAADVHDAAVEGTELGQYPAGSKATLRAAIDTAIGVYNKAGATQQEVDQAVSTLEAAIAAFKASMKSLVIPTGLTAKEVNGAIQLSWQATPDAITYNVKRALSLGGPYTTIASGLTSTTYTDTVATGINYFYAVTAASGTFETVNSGIAYTKILGKYQLKDLPLLKTANNDGWTGGDGNCVEATSASTLPMDNDMKLNNLPSARLNVYKTGTWWCSLIAGPSWNTYSLEQYYANGVLEFNIKGAEGGEDFSLGFYDKDPTRNPVEGGKTVSITNFVKVTKNWQHVAIPIKSLVDPATFRLRSTTYLRLDRNGATAKQIYKVWLNDMKVSSTDNEKNYPFIKVNQLGYTVKSEKYAQVTGFDGALTASAGTAFKVKNATTGAVVYTGTLKLVTDNDAAVSGERVLRAYFTALTTPGTYYISVDAPGIQDSYKFKIGDDVYKSLITDASRYFYYQRANMSLTSQYAGIFARNDFTPGDFAAPLKSDLAGAKRDVSKGWYDAGDFGKYTDAGAMAISDLLWAYEIYPTRFTDNQFNIPESGNKVPDLLDEVKYELDWLLKMQDTDGGFFHRVFPQTKENASDPRYIDDVRDSLTNLKPTSHTGDAVGVLAHAYLVYKNFDAAYANTLLAAAQKGWTYLEQHPQVVLSLTGPYNDDDDKNDRLYAAGALFRATGTAKYNDYFKANYQSFAKIFDNPENAHGWGSLELPGFLHYMSSSAKDTTVASWFKTKFLNWRSVQMVRSYKGAWRNTLRETDYYWGSNSPVLTTTMDMVIGSKLIGDYNNQVINVARANMNYILGINPMTFSYVSGYGENCLSNSFSGIYNEDGIASMPKGYLAGGANMFDASWFSRFNGKCYNDVNTEWTSNEHTIYWNSGLVFSAALLDGETAALSGQLKTITLAASTKDPYLGNTVTLSFSEARMDDDKTADLKSANIVYTSLNPSLATVDANGVVKTLKKGNVTITATVTLGETTLTSSITLNIR